jgi:hypothetical protein
VEHPPPILISNLEKSEHACNILVGKPKGKRPLGRSRRRWEDAVEEQDVGVWTELDCFGIESSGGIL